MDQTMPDQTWHAIKTISGWERRVVDALVEKGFSPYLPQLTETTRTPRGRRRLRIVMIMPSYVFVPLELATQAWAGINRRDVKGIGSGLIKSGDHPAHVTKAEMDRVLELGEDRDRIVEWLRGAGKVRRISNKARRRQAAWNRRLALSRVA
jgi:transcription antitermination factor NusG